MPRVWQVEACRDRLCDFGDRCHPRRVRHDKDNPEASASGTGGSIRVVNPELVEFKAQVGILQSGKPKLEKIEVQLKDLSARTAHAGVVQRRDANCLPWSRLAFRHAHLELQRCELPRGNVLAWALKSQLSFFAAGLRAWSSFSQTALLQTYRSPQATTGLKDVDLRRLQADFMATVRSVIRMMATLNREGIGMHAHLVQLLLRLDYNNYFSGTEALQCNVLIMTLPCLQHLRFYFGYWGLELGMVYDISFFLLLSSTTITVLTYFLFFQAYIMPLEMSILTIAVAAVIVESVCGIINVLQTLKLAPLTFFQTLLVLSAIISVIMVTSGFLVKELLPNEITFDHYWMPADGQPYAVAAPSS
eukprot:s18_g17.t6